MDLKLPANLKLPTKLKRPSKLDGYYGLLKAVSLVEDAKFNFLYDIFDFAYNPKTRILEFSGFAFTKEEKLPVNFEIAKDQGEIVEFKRTNIYSVNMREQIPDNVDIGFHLAIRLPEGVEKVDTFDFIIKNQVTGKTLPITARPDMHLYFSPVDYFEYYNKIRLNKGLRKMLDQHKKQGKHVWDGYNFWLDKQESVDIEQLYSEMAGFEYNPKISIVVPVYDVEERWLRRMVNSILNQYYDNWELVLADDNSPSPHVKKVISEYCAMDPRIKFVQRDVNGHISEATNSALDLATGDYIGFLDHDDEIEPHTLFEVVKAINEDRDTDFIYTDQDFIDEEGYRTEPFFKSHWNPRLLLTQNYISHFLVVSRDLLEKTGKLRSAYDGSQDYDFDLRATANAKKIKHIPKTLYHWRVIRGSVAEDPEAKGYAYESGTNAINDYLRRQGIGAKAEESPYYGIYDIIRDDKPLTSIVIVAEDGVEPAQTLKDVLEHTDYENFEVVAVNFEDEDKLEDERVHYYYNNAPLTLKELYDFGAAKAEGDYLVMFEPGTRPLKDGWLTSMVNETALPDTGIVTAFFVNKADRVINAGFSFDTVSNQTMYSHRDTPVGPTDIGYYFRLATPQNVVAGSSACLLIPKDLWNELGGYTEGFDMPLREIDLSLRAKKLGKDTVWQPNAKMMWMGDMQTVPNLHKKERPYFYMEAHPKQTLKFLEKYTAEELDDPYAPDLIKRFRRLANPYYTGPEEYRDV